MPNAQHQEVGQHLLHQAARQPQSSLQRMLHVDQSSSGQSSLADGRSRAQHAH